MLGVHYVIRQINLAIQIFSTLQIVSKVKVLLQYVYTYYSNSPKQQLDICKFVDVLQCENIMDFHAFSCQFFLTKYKSLSAQMFEEHLVHDFFKANLELLCDNEVFLGLICIIPILQCVQGMSKFAQTYYVLICNFNVVKTFRWIYITCIMNPHLGIEYADFCYFCFIYITSRINQNITTTYVTTCELQLFATSFESFCSYKIKF